MNKEQKSTVREIENKVSLVVNLGLVDTINFVKNYDNKNVVMCYLNPRRFLRGEPFTLSGRGKLTVMKNTVNIDGSFYDAHGREYSTTGKLIFIEEIISIKDLTM